MIYFVYLFNEVKVLCLYKGEKVVSTEIPNPWYCNIKFWHIIFIPHYEVFIFCILIHISSFSSASIRYFFAKYAFLREVYFVFYCILTNKLLELVVWMCSKRSVNIKFLSTTNPTKGTQQNWPTKIVKN